MGTWVFTRRHSVCSSQQSSPGLVKAQPRSGWLLQARLALLGSSPHLPVGPAGQSTGPPDLPPPFPGDRVPEWASPTATAHEGLHPGTHKPRGGEGCRKGTRPLIALFSLHASKPLPESQSERASGEGPGSPRRKKASAELGRSDSPAQVAEIGCSAGSRGLRFINTGAGRQAPLPSLEVSGFLVDS